MTNAIKKLRWTKYKPFLAVAKLDVVLRSSYDKWIMLSVQIRQIRWFVFINRDSSKRFRNSNILRCSDFQYFVISFNIVILFPNVSTTEASSVKEHFRS
jgi:hypothetical protein